MFYLMTHSTFYLRLYGVGFRGSSEDSSTGRPAVVARWGRTRNRKGRKKKVYLTTHSTHFIYGYMASDIW